MLYFYEFPVKPIVMAKFFFHVTAGTAIAIAHCNSVHPMASVCLSICHMGASVKIGAS